MNTHVKQSVRMVMGLLVGLTILDSARAEIRQTKVAVPAKSCVHNLEKRSKLSYDCKLDLSQELGKNAVIVQGEEVQMKFSNCTVSVKSGTDGYSLSLTKDYDSKQRDFLKADAENCLQKAITVENLDQKKLSVIVSQ